MDIDIYSSNYEGYLMMFEYDDVFTICSQAEPDGVINQKSIRPVIWNNHVVNCTYLTESLQEWNLSISHHRKFSHLFSCRILLSTCRRGDAFH